MREQVRRVAGPGPAGAAQCVRLNFGFATRMTLPAPDLPPATAPANPLAAGLGTGTLAAAVTAAATQRLQLDMAAALADIVPWQYDVASGLLQSTERGWAMLGLVGPPQGLPLATLAAWLHPDDRAAVEAQAAAARGTDSRPPAPIDLALRLRHASGRWLHLSTRRVEQRDAEGRWLGHVGVAQDLTGRIDAQQQAQAQAQRLALASATATATAAAGVGLWSLALDPPGALQWDAQMRALHGLAPEQPAPSLDAYIADHVHPDDRAGVADSLATLMQHRDGLLDLDLRVLLPGGGVRWLASRSSPVRDEHGRTLRRIGINWDITDARNAASTRQERLLTQRESQAKSRFLARISHELRTPLNAVLGFSQLLLAHGAEADPATWRRRVEHVQASGEHLLALIDDVLALSSLASDELPRALEPVALAPLVETSLPLVELLARAHGVGLQLGPLAGWALADPVRLRQVLLNLLSNAIKYNHPGGSVTVSTELQDGWLLLRVTDTGCGLDAEQIGHLFEPFNRLGREADGIAGTGIGLAIVQASVQQMGGTVQVRSQPGQGSCFEVGLQAVNAPGPAPGLVGLAGPAGPGVAEPGPGGHVPGGGRLLYIEDNEVNLLIVSELVRGRSDIQFSSAADGASGLAAARAQAPALILLDMHLPDMDGHEVLRRLRADPATAGIRCIALSANAMPDDIRQALENGFDDYWTKPLDLRAFSRALDRLFGVAPG